MLIDKNTLRILFVCSAREVFNLKLMSSFSREYYTHEVYVITSEEELTKSERDYFAGTNIRYLGTLNSFTFKNLRKTLISRQTIKMAIKKYRIDITVFSFATPYSLWGNFLKTPYIIYTRGSDVYKDIPGLMGSGPADLALFKLYKRAFRRAARLVSTSIKQELAIQDYFGYNLFVHVIRTGIDVTKIASVKPKLPEGLEGVKYIFAPSYLAPIYNNELLVESVKHLSDKTQKEITFVFIKPKTHLVDNNYLSGFENKLKQYQNIKYLILEEVDQETMFSLYKKASVTVITPTSDGTPSSALEAMAAKCPLILGDYPYDQDLFESMCFKLKENTPVCLAENVEKAISGYPTELLEKAYLNVNERGNIKYEIEKLNGIFEEVK